MQTETIKLRSGTKVTLDAKLLPYAREIRGVSSFGYLTPAASDALFPVEAFKGARRASILWLIETAQIEAVHTAEGLHLKGSDVLWWSLLR